VKSFDFCKELEDIERTHIGLAIIVLSGMDLCTGSILYTTLAALSGRLSPLLMLRHWGVTFLGNLVGVLFVSSLITGCEWTIPASSGPLKLTCHEDGGAFDHEPFQKTAINFAVTKQVEPRWHQIFIRGIGANWLGATESRPLSSYCK
jgi:formate/nitrite transporter FocA (FNT family)